MKATALLVSWHNENTPIYSAHFEPPHGKGRLATAGGDNNVRLWRIESTGEDRKVVYLSTLVKHTQAVNVVRWSPRGETLASAGDDGNVLLWVPSENQSVSSNFEEDGLEDKEKWRVKHMCRSNTSCEIYDLAWAPDGKFFMTGSTDNVTRIYDAHTGQTVRQIAEHNHFVQGVAWDPKNEYIATQSSDRSVHIAKLTTQDGSFVLGNPHKVSKMDLPARRISSHSPAPADFNRASFVSDSSTLAVGSPVPSAPGTPNSLALPMPMNPPRTSASRRSSFGSSASVRRSMSPAASMPLPAVMPSTSPNIHATLGVRNTNIYYNETLTSFFRRLTFSPDGSLLFTPAGQYKTVRPTQGEPPKGSDEIQNTVYIYTRAGLNKTPVAHLPGHKKPSIAVKCSPVLYTLRPNSSTLPTKQITVDTSSAEDEIPALPEPAFQSKPPVSKSTMEPPPFTSAPSPSPSMAAPSPKTVDPESTSGTSSDLPAGPQSAFDLPHRIVYAVATQDAIYIHDTQQFTPICVVSNLHFATFTDLTWSNDGNTLLMTSSDGFCSCLTFAPGELGQRITESTKSHPTFINTAAASSAQSTPTPTPTSSSMPTQAKLPPAAFPASPSSFAPNRPTSPARSMSTSSIATESSFIQTQQGIIANNPTPAVSTIPGVAATNSGSIGGMPMWTPPMTPMPGGHSAASSVGGNIPIQQRKESESEASETPRSPKKREAEAIAEKGDGKTNKKRRIAPTLVSEAEMEAPKVSQPAAVAPTPADIPASENQK
ncbi:WD40 repeat-like protein [Patellaria atrata CBS 101060]|uniref:WD40 repeat-like protein n=1 Tax=Patellaria atrata CBS 101060 TaxID=1346257 RepID=A0A9P4S3A7_9PEZI|nr:WD40 repeat-like protein [Patellaria atrata CBS 101060]